MSGVTDNWVGWRFKNEHEDLGMFGERLWSNIFRGCGLFYIPLKDLPPINGKGPRLQGSDAILPDFQVTGQRQAFVDSKCKSGPVLFKKANEWRHGIDRKDYESYSAVSEIQRTKCALAICEVYDSDDRERRNWRGALLLQTLGNLGPPIRGFSNQDHMIYWPRDRFAELVPGMSPERMWRIAEGQMQPDAELRAGLLKVLSSKETIQGRIW